MTGRPALRITPVDTLCPSFRAREPTTMSRALLSRANSEIRRLGEPSRISPSAGTPALSATASALSSTRFLVTRAREGPG
jgi:hypothetical protein